MLKISEGWTGTVIRAAAVAVLMACHSRTASASFWKPTTPFADRAPGGKALLLLGSTAASVLYTPVKAVYALGGTVAGGMVFLMSAGQSATAGGKIIQRTTRGDWFVHPDHLTGNRKLRFRATAPTYTPAYY